MIEAEGIWITISFPRVAPWDDHSDERPACVIVKNNGLSTLDYYRLASDYYLGDTPASVAKLP